MSERMEHKRRYNQHLTFIARFENWMEREPPMWRVISWHAWKNERPVWRSIEKEERKNE